MLAGIGYACTGFNVLIQHNFISVLLDKTMKIGSMISFIAIKKCSYGLQCRKQALRPYVFVVKTVSIP